MNQMHKRALESVQAMMAEYGGQAIPEHVRTKLDAVRLAGHDTEHMAYTKAMEVAQVHFLYLWSQGKIRGKVTEQSLERNAKKLEKLSEFFFRKGDDKKAEAMKHKAEEIRNTKPTDYKKEIRMSKLTAPQQKIVDFVSSKGGSVTMADLRHEKFDTRAINNLIKQGIIKLPKEGEAKVAPKSAKKNRNPTGKCLCGCGAPVKGMFLQGHDAKLHSAVLKGSNYHKGVATIAYLKTAPWMTPDLSKHAGL